MRLYTLILVFLIVCSGAFAMDCGPDSIGVKTVEGKRYIVHKIKSGEGWYGIARKYSVTVPDLRAVNKGMGDNLKLDDTVLVPVVSKSGGEEHVVKAKKTEDAGQKTEDKKEATLTSDTAKKAHAAKTTKSKTNTTEVVNVSDDGLLAKPAKEVKETGVASWISDDDINPNKYYALHRTATTGTIIKVINRMNNKFVFVKVVGKLPDTGDNTDMIIKISKASAEKLGVRDQKFQCELNFMAAVN